MNKKVSLETFFRKVKEGGSLLLLDYDGTLAPFHINPERAKPYEGVFERLLQLLESKKTKVIIISGREVQTLAGLLDMEKLPELWGSHGTERLLKNGEYSRVKISKKQREGIERGLWYVLEHISPDRFENKTASIAIHWRGLSEEKKTKMKEAVFPQWEKIARMCDLEVHDFDGGLELRPRGFSKAIAIQIILEEQKDEGQIAYLGDDKTDEEAFQELGERGLKVLVRKKIRETKADIHIQPPGELLGFLDRWIECST